MGPHTVYVEVRDKATATRVATWAVGHDVCLISPPDCAAFMGLPWWQFVIRDSSLKSVLDCGTSANLAATALRAGVDGVIVTVTDAQFLSLQSLTTVTQGTVYSMRPESIRLDPDHPIRHQHDLMIAALQRASPERKE